MVVENGGHMASNELPGSDSSIVDLCLALKTKLLQPAGPEGYVPIHDIFRVITCRWFSPAALETCYRLHRLVLS